MNHSYNGKVSINDMDLDSNIIEPEPNEESESE
jgi:hypothetical protein|eukprot:CAMPEP_0168315910 /NCGR_PEP_ID=MMETSP0210-20121227/13221_1 /TAXON_ID=40633 /ORGANISM="Condylostoma magnum, Strain COL2" /LENGTH=32 /DNA_ID= /DNA_START= /DNA_END= /DNA_ORIENTATION=